MEDPFSLAVISRLRALRDAHHRDLKPKRITPSAGDSMAAHNVVAGMQKVPQDAVNAIQEPRPPVKRW